MFKTIILLIISILTFTQVTYSQKNDNYLAYYKEIIKTENHIFNNNFSSAAKKYDSLFTIYTPLEKDLFNASLVHAKLGNKNQTKKYVQMLLEKEVPKSVFNSNEFKLIKPYLKHSSNISNSKKTKTDSISNRIDSLFNMDQKFRLKAGSYEKYGDTIKAIDSLNMVEIVKLMKNYEFPEYSVLNSRKKEIFHKAYIILRHHYQNKKNISTILHTYLKKGLIPPYLFAELEDKKHSINNKGKSKYGTTVLAVFKWALIAKYNHFIYKKSNYFDEIELARKNIGLHNQDIFLKIAQRKHRRLGKDFIFDYYESKVIIVGKPPIRLKT